MITFILRFIISALFHDHIVKRIFAMLKLSSNVRFACIFEDPGVDSWFRRRPNLVNLQERTSSCKLTSFNFLLAQLSAPGSPKMYRMVCVRNKIIPSSYTSRLGFYYRMGFDQFWFEKRVCLAYTVPKCV